MFDDLGDRMKNNYENISRSFLPRRMPMIIRVDGKAFHTLTHDMKIPWDDGMIDSMLFTAKYLCEHVQNVKLAYVQSDEISLLLTDYDRLATEAWFNRNLQKMVSVSAAFATLAFNKQIAKYYPEKSGVFDSRAFVIPKEEVCNYFLWRQNDASRNSVQMLARAYFSHKQLENLNNSQIQDRLMLEKGVNWNDVPTHKKRGACVRTVSDGGWQIDLEPPFFSKDRGYINNLLVAEEE
jgi:tRNA(His) guanylyltransferase